MTIEIIENNLANVQSTKKFKLIAVIPFNREIDQSFAQRVAGGSHPMAVYYEFATLRFSRVQMNASRSRKDPISSLVGRSVATAFIYFA